MIERVIIDNVSKKFKIGFAKEQGALSKIISFFSGREPKKDLWSLTDVSFSVKAGERVGIIGVNGSGKSTLLRLIANIYQPDKGKIKTTGNIVSAIGSGTSLYDRLSMKENIYLLCSLFGLNKKTTKKRFDSIVEFSGLEDYVNTKLYQFSNGMTYRLGSSILHHCNPDIILYDEVFIHRDEQFSQKEKVSMNKIVNNGACYLFVTHDLETARRSDRLIWLNKGKIIEMGNPEEVIQSYKKFFNL
ncbi:MAG: hypothetical protein CMI53_03880 [Parcubacteria group bacterium]|nr:hypothetical protein [Parcubacteria group bacterium]|tara:strand:+ start:1033 stop:1767 length:735 start_codon:yes stop_codon:yes gene_type:complete